MCHITVWFCRTIQVDIAYAVVVASINRAADVPSVQCVQSDIEAHAETGIPVAVNILRSCDASARRLVVRHNVTNGVAGGLPRTVHAETPVPLGLWHLEAEAVGDKLRLSHHLEVCSQVSSKRRLQSGITHVDVQRVSIIVYVEQLGDVWLLRLSAELHLQVNLLVEAHSEIHRRRYVGDCPHSIDGYAQILLDVV